MLTGSGEEVYPRPLPLAVRVAYSVRFDLSTMRMVIRTLPGSEPRVDSHGIGAWRTLQGPTGPRCLGPANVPARDLDQIHATTGTTTASTAIDVSCACLSPNRITGVS